MAQKPVQSKLFQFKLVLLGESAVGKSSLVLRFVKDQFSDYRESTVSHPLLRDYLSLLHHSRNERAADFPNRVLISLRSVLLSSRKRSVSMSRRQSSLRSGKYMRTAFFATKPATCTDYLGTLRVKNDTNLWRQCIIAMPTAP